MILSICIPTYMRPECIYKSLQNYQQITKGLENEVEICISDNNPDFETEKIVLDFLRCSPNFKYSRNGKNIGADLNNIKALELGEGKYLHLVSDEDIYSEETLKKIVLILKTNPDMIHIPTYHLSNWNKLRELNDEISGDNLVSLSLSERGTELGYLVGFCWNIIKKEDFDSIKPLLLSDENLKSSLITHMALFLYCMKKSNMVKILKSDYRKYTQIPKIEKGTLPDEYVLLYHKKYNFMVNWCKKKNIITNQDFNLYKYGYDNFVIKDLIKIRSRIPPELATTQCKSINKHLNHVLSPLIFNPIIPYHLLYRLFIYYKNNLKHENRTDLHEYYRNLVKNKVMTIEKYGYES